MLEKNVVIVRKNPDGVSEKVKINCIEDNIQLSANIVDSNLSSYGVPPSIVNTMDVAVQVVVMYIIVFSFYLMSWLLK